jgi:hypothetical protein
MADAPRRAATVPGRRFVEVVTESLRVWRRLVTRGLRLESNEFPYRNQVATGHVPLLALLAFPVEILLVMRLAPWGWLMWALVAISALGFAWLVALYASFFVLPHRLGPESLDIHYGLVDQITIPFAAIDKVAVDTWDAPTDRDGLHLSDDHFVASLPVAHRTQLALLLRAPLTESPGIPAEVRVIRFAVDEPEAMARAIITRIARRST